MISFDKKQKRSQFLLSLTAFLSLSAALMGWLIGTFGMNLQDLLAKAGIHLSGGACLLCKVERYTFLIGGLVALAVRVLPFLRSLFLRGLFWLFLSGTLVSFFHLGIQYRIFNTPSVCKISKTEPKTLEDLQNKIEAVSCDEITMKIFDIPLSFYSGVLMALLTILMMMAYHKPKDQYTY